LEWACLQMNRPHQQSSNKNSESPSDIPQISFSLFIQRYIIKIKYRETRKNQSQEGVNIFLLAILKVHISSMHILYITCLYLRLIFSHVSTWFILKRWNQDAHFSFPSKTVHTDQLPRKRKANMSQISQMQSFLSCDISQRQKSKSK